LQLRFPALDIALQRGSVSPDAGNSVIFGELSAQPRIVAGRVVRNRQVQARLVDRLFAGHRSLLMPNVCAMAMPE
jgi:hypothetical protein